MKAVYTGDDGLLYGLSAKNVLLIDSSTINPAVSKEVHGAAKDAGAVFVDAPVSGGERRDNRDIKSLSYFSFFSVSILNEPTNFYGITYNHCLMYFFTKELFALSNDTQ